MTLTKRISFGRGVDRREEVLYAKTATGKKTGSAGSQAWTGTALSRRNSQCRGKG